jgi:low affinity Fe/Cu permease
MSNERRRSIAERQADLARDHEERRWRRGLFRGASHHDDWLGRNWASRLLHRVGEVVADAGAGIVAALAALAWVVVGAVTGFPTWWATLLYSVTACVTFVMVFVIQHTQTRQIIAVQRKLDELLRATPGDNSLIAVEEASDEELQALADLNLDDRSAAVDENGAGLDRPPAP